MASVTLDEAAITAAIQQKLNANTRRGWILCGYQTPSHIVLQKTGDGDTAELVSNLADDQVQYAIIRLPDNKDGTETVRDVLVCWTGMFGYFRLPYCLRLTTQSDAGPAVKKIEAAKKKTHLGAVRNVLKPSHAEVEAINRANFTEATLMSRSAPLSGSHVID